jgi:hypothetical protein
MYKEAKARISEGLISACERAYVLGRQALKYRIGMVADYIAVVGYLLLSDPDVSNDLIS